MDLEPKLEFDPITGMAKFVFVDRAQDEAMKSEEAWNKVDGLNLSFSKKIDEFVIPDSDGKGK